MTDIDRGCEKDPSRHRPPVCESHLQSASNKNGAAPNLRGDTASRAANASTLRPGTGLNLRNIIDLRPDDCFETGDRHQLIAVLGTRP